MVKKGGGDGHLSTPGSAGLVGEWPRMGRMSVIKLWMPMFPVRILLDYVSNPFMKFQKNKMKKPYHLKEFFLSASTKAPRF